MTVWTATKETPKELVDMARVLLSAVGEQIQVMVGAPLFPFPHNTNLYSYNGSFEDDTCSDR